MATRSGAARPTGRWRVARGLVAALVVVASLAAPASGADPLPQEITVSLPASLEAGTSSPIDASATSALAVDVVSDTPETCSVADGALIALSPGLCSVTASQAGDDTYAPAISVQATTTVEPAFVEPAPQTITFSLPASVLVDATIVLDATSTSGLPVSYVADTPGTCSVADGILTAVAPGSCTVTASQAGNGEWAPADSVQATTSVEPLPPDPVAQTITFALPSSTLVGSSLALGGTTDSGLPVSYTSNTPSICSVSDTTLKALAAGTCTVTASQPGSDAYLPAPDVAASMAVEPVPQGVDLGKYAVNGPVRDVVVEPGTGRTILGGDFSQIGVRTGPVAVVDPPDLGNGTLRPASPEVLGTVATVIADDRPDDPGFFIVGQLIAVNGSPVPTSPVTRVHLDEGANRWVVDASWTVHDPAGLCTGLAQSNMWVGTDDALVTGGNTYPTNLAGLSSVDRVTGDCTVLLPDVEQPLPVLDTCTELLYCTATMTRLTWDPDSNALFVTYIAWIGETSGGTTRTWFLTGYDLDGGTHTWTMQLQAAPGDNTSAHPDAVVTSLFALDSTVIVRGRFPLDAGGSEADASLVLSVDAATGAIAQRWNRHGAQELDDGSTSGPAGSCFTTEFTRATLFAFQDGAAQWIERDPLLCEYTVTGGILTGEPNGATLTEDDGFIVPTTEYEAPGGADYLVGPWLAVDVATGEVVDWHPEPGTTHASTAVALSTAGIVIGGDFQFVRGNTAQGVVALTASLSPDPAFSSPLIQEGTIRSLLLHDGWLLVGGEFFVPGSGPGGRDPASLVAVDPHTGAFIDWTPDTTLPRIVETFAVNGANGEFWVGGSSERLDDPEGPSLLRFEAPSDGADRLPAPSLGCLDAPVVDDLWPSQPACDVPGHNGTHVLSLAFAADGRLYLGGAFGSVDGEVRRGLARLDASGAVDAWNPDLLGVLPIPDGSGMYNLEPRAIAVHGDRVLVGGNFQWVTPHTGGGGAIDYMSPLIVLSTSSGALLRPSSSDPDRFAWFPIGGMLTTGSDILVRAGGIVVALGDAGVMVLNVTTLDYDAGASAPFITTNWWGKDSRNGVFALAGPPPPSTSATASVLTTTASNRVVVAGSIPRWGNRVAGNMLASGIGNMAAPSVTTPKLQPRVGKALSGSSLPISLTWTASKGLGVALDHYVVQKSTNGGPWATVSSTIKGTSFSTYISSSGSVRFRVQAVNQNGIASTWATGPTLSGRLVQQSSSAVSYRGTWRTATSGSYSGGSTRYTRTSGSKATYTFTGRSVALVTTKSPTRGKVKVYVNGSYVTTVDLYASAAHHRIVAWQKTWTTSAKRTLTVVAAGPSSRPRIDVDAFLYVK